MGGGRHESHPEREHQLLDRQDDEEAPPVDFVGQEAADHGEDQGGPELGKDDDADERGRVREVVGVGAENDVLHPRADVRGEGAEEDDAEGPVRQCRPRRAGSGGKGSVPVDDRVLDLLYGDGAVVGSRHRSGSRVTPGPAVVGRGRHLPSYGRPSTPFVARARFRTIGTTRPGRSPTSRDVSALRAPVPSRIALDLVLRAFDVGSVLEGRPGAALPPRLSPWSTAARGARS